MKIIPTTPLTFRIATLAALALVLLFSHAGAYAAETDLSPFDYPPDAARQEGDTEWHLWYLQPPETHESIPKKGIHGKLYKGGKEVIATAAGERLDSPMGAFAWHGSVEERQNPSDASGWLPEGYETKPFDPAWQQRAHIALAYRESKVRQGTLTTDSFFRKKQGNALYLMQTDRSKSTFIPPCITGYLRVDGKWIVSAQPGERVHCDLGEFIWEAPPMPDSLASPAPVFLNWYWTEMPRR